MISLKVLSSSAEDEEKNASIEDSLVAFFEAKVRSVKLGLVMTTDSIAIFLKDCCP